MRHVERILDLVDRLVEGLCHLLILTIVAITVLQVVLRFIFNDPTSWSEEVALLLLVWFGMLAIALAVRRHGHIAITALRDALPAVVGRALDAFSQLVILVFAVVLGWGGQELVALAGIQRLPASGIGKLWLYLPAIVGGVLMALNALGNLASGRIAPEPGETLS